MQKCNSFDTKLKTELIITPNHIISGFYCDSINTNKILPLICNDVPNAINISNFELLYHKKRIDDDDQKNQQTDTESIELIIRADVIEFDFLNVFLQNAGLNKIDQSNIEFIGKNFYFDPSDQTDTYTQSRYLPIHLDINLNKDKTRNTMKIKQAFSDETLN